jgi:hypothetical protein
VGRRTLVVAEPALVHQSAAVLHGVGCLEGRRRAQAGSCVMTAEEWKKVEAALQSPYGRAVLAVDSYELTLQVQQLKPLKFAIGFYVDGWFKGEWLTSDCEERRRFCRRMESAVYSPAQRAKITKGFSKRNVAKYFPDMAKKFTWYSNAWSSFGALKRHLVANNQQIELKECA